MKNNIRLLYLHNFLTDVRFHGAFLVIYLAQISGSYTSAMAILAAETITSAIMDIPTGIFSDRLGRKYTLAAGSSCMTAALACYAFADGSLQLYIAAIFHGLGCCLFNGNNDALLYETLKASGQENEFHHYQGRAGSMFQLALGLSALCASFLTGYGLRFIFMLGIAPQAVAAIVSLFFAEPRIHIPPKRNSWEHVKLACRDIYGNPRLLLLVTGQAISWGAGESNFNFKNVFVSQLWPLWAVSAYRACGNGLGFAGFWFAGPILERVKASRMLVLAGSYALVSEGLAVLIANYSSPLFLLSNSVLFGPFMVARDKLLQQEFTDEQRATMGSVASFAGSIVFTIAAFCIGIISDCWGVAAGVGFGVVACALSLPFYVKLLRRDF